MTGPAHDVDVDERLPLATRAALGGVQLVGGVSVGLGCLLAMGLVLGWLTMEGLMPGGVGNALGFLGAPFCFGAGVFAARRVRRFQERRLHRALTPPAFVPTSSGSLSTSTAVP